MEERPTAHMDGVRWGGGTRGARIHRAPPLSPPPPPSSQHKETRGRESKRLGSPAPLPPLRGEHPASARVDRRQDRRQHERRRAAAARRPRRRRRRRRRREKQALALEDGFGLVVGESMWWCLGRRRAAHDRHPLRQRRRRPRRRRPRRHVDRLERAPLLQSGAIGARALAGRARGGGRLGAVEPRQLARLLVRPAHVLPHGLPVPHRRVEILEQDVQSARLTPGRQVEASPQLGLGRAVEGPPTRVRLHQRRQRELVQPLSADVVNVPFSGTARDPRGQRGELVVVVILDCSHTGAGLDQRLDRGSARHAQGRSRRGEGV
mmetsp:Transcript_38475/g.96021  ORF Transcript_38475/g.96021 Transcript_38475/m.96021 type:complete len:321 (-) Transcript_38475:7-969(-)